MRPADLSRAARDTTYLVLVVVAFADQLGYGVIAPVLPELQERTGATDAGVGLLVAAFPLGLLVGLVPATLALRAATSRRVLVVSLLLVAGGHLGFAGVEGYGPWWAARALAGIGSAGLWMAVLTTVRRRWPQSVGPRIGGVLAAYGLGTIVGPLVGGLGGTVRPFVVVAACALLLVPFAARIAPVRLPGDPLRLGRVARSPAVALPASVNLVLGLAIATLEGAYPLHFGTRLGAPGIAVLFLAASVPLVVAPPLAGRLSSETGDARRLGFALLVLGVAATLVPMTSVIAAWVVLLAVIGAAVGAGETWTTTLLHRASREAETLGGSLVWTVGFVAGYAIGSPVAGTIATVVGTAASGLVVLASCLALAAHLARR